MRKFNLLTVMLVLTLGIMFNVDQALALADAANEATVVIEDNDLYAEYQIAFTFSTDDSTNNLTSKAMYIGFSDNYNNPGVIHVEFTVAPSGTDVHFYAGGAMDGDLSAVSYDPLDTSLDCDIDAIANRCTTLGWRTSVSTLTESSILISPAAGCDYLVIKADGQAGNTSTVAATVTVKVWKMPGLSQVKAHVLSTT